jgi:gluconate 2-dehydrogenase gamma chain
MNKKQQSRRRFIQASGSMLAGALAGINMPALLGLGESAALARDGGQAFKVLDLLEAADLQAITAQIIPSDGTPGAREAGVIYFIDGAMAAMFAGMLPDLRGGLGKLNDTIPGDDRRFADLADAEQKALLQQEEDSEFFGMVRFLTLAGMFSLPEYGGNRDHLGWKLIGFDHRHAWSPPFGYYDARYGEGGSGHETS